MTREPLKSLIEAEPGDLVSWMIPMMHDRYGVGIVLSTQREELQVYKWERPTFFFYVKIRWQRGGTVRYSMNWRGAGDIGKSLWRFKK